MMWLMVILWTMGGDDTDDVAHILETCLLAVLSVAHTAKNAFRDSSCQSANREALRETMRKY